MICFEWEKSYYNEKLIQRSWGLFVFKVVYVAQSKV